MRLAVDHRQDASIGDEWRAGENLAAVVLDQQHLLERELGARLARGPGQRGRLAGDDLQLLPAAPDDGVHNRHLWKGFSVAPKSLTCKELAAP